MPPTTPVTQLHALISAKKIQFSNTALTSISHLNLTSHQARQILLTITDACFYKTMPSTVVTVTPVMHDVYHVPHNGIVLYIKLVVTHVVCVMSFKVKQ